MPGSCFLGIAAETATIKQLARRADIALMRIRIAEVEFPDSLGVYIVYETEKAQRPLYVGVAAKQTTKKRWKANHLRSRAGGSSLRRTLGVHLGLVEAKLKRPDRYYPEDVEAAITAYLEERWIEFIVTETGDEARELEVRMIKDQEPQLNVTHRRRSA